MPYIDRDNDGTVKSIYLRPQYKGQEYIDGVVELPDKRTYSELRRTRMIDRYNVTDQLGIVLDGFNTMRLAGINLPQELDDLVGFYLAGKNTYPKPEEKK